MQTRGRYSVASSPPQLHVAMAGLYLSAASTKKEAFGLLMRLNDDDLYRVSYGRCVQRGYCLRETLANQRYCMSGINLPGDLDLYPFNPWNWYALLPVQSVYQVWTSLAFSLGRYDTLSVTALVGLVTWPLTFWSYNSFTGYSCDGLPSCQFW